MKNCTSNHFFSSPTLSYWFILLGLFAFVPAQALVTYSAPLQGDEHLIGNLLEWKTSQEMRSKTFLVEKSEDGINYESIGTVEAAGESSAEMGYRFLDINATSTKSFYRLKQVDVDGAFSHSEIALVNRIIPNQFMVLNMTQPRTNGLFTCAIDAMNATTLTYQLLDLNNEVIQSGQVDMYAGLNELSVDLTNEAEGFYQFVLIVENEIEQLMLQKVMDEAQVKENVALKDKE